MGAGRNNAFKEAPMKKILFNTTLVLAVLAGTAGPSSAGVQAALSVGNGGLESFTLSIGDYYRVPRERVVIVRERHIPDEEIPVVFFVAREARVTPEAVVQQRLTGRSWMQIALRLGLGPDVFHVSVGRPLGPYARPCGYFTRTSRTQWRKIRLKDAEVVNLVNLRFLSEHYRRSPDEIVSMRSHGKQFKDIDGDLRSRPSPESYGKDRDRYARRGDGDRQASDVGFNHGNRNPRSR
jgi:hypothetical protein